jgi:hypothetical protein
MLLPTTLIHQAYIGDTDNLSTYSLVLVHNALKTRASALAAQAQHSADHEKPLPARIGPLTLMSMLFSSYVEPLLDAP